MVVIAITLTNYKIEEKTWLTSVLFVEYYIKEILTSNKEPFFSGSLLFRSFFSFRYNGGVLF